jgi:predicted alpha/beta-fold hydrolase
MRRKMRTVLRADKGHSASYNATRMETIRLPRWLGSRHLQSLGAALPLHAPPRSFARPRDARMEFPLDGGALVAFAWWLEGKRPAVLLVHGVGGSSESRYLLRAAVALRGAGYHVVRLNMRGAGESVVRAPSLHHAGMSGDLDAAARAVAADPRVSSVAVVGFSLGGNVALKLAGEWGDAPPAGVVAVATISAPTDLVECSRLLEAPRALPYRAWVVRNLVRQARAFAEYHPSRARYDVAALARVRRIRDYDARVIVPMHGFSSPEDYYARTSAGPYLGKIRVPTLMVHADDDPMVPGHTVRPSLRELPPCVKVAWSDVGGHVGWFAGLDEARWTRTWAMEKVVAFLGDVR